MWQDTLTMAADALTKEVTGPSALDNLMNTSKYAFWCPAADTLGAKKVECEA